MRTSRVNGWSDELLRAFLTNTGKVMSGHSIYPLIISRAQKEFELWREGSSSRVSFFANLGVDAVGPLAMIRSSIWVSEPRGNTRADELSSDKVGYLTLSERDTLDGSKIPTLNIVLLGERSLEIQLLELLSTARGFGIGFFPMWIFVDTTPLTSLNATEAIEFSIRSQLAISKCSYQQILDLKTVPNQDDLWR